MILRARADSLELDAGENGWSLIAETDEGDTIVLNLHGIAYKFAGSKGLAELQAWRAEGQRERVDAWRRSGAYICTIDESAGLADAD